MGGRGLFVTFEGIEGTGKSTQASRAADYLRSRGVDVVLTREPGGTQLGAALRSLLLDPNRHVDPKAELLLLFADRVQHLTETIRPALENGTLVLSDRYVDASRAYQGAGRRLGEPLVDGLFESFCRLVPDRTFLLDCPVPLALSRVAGRGSTDRFERESLLFHRRVRAAYRRRAVREPRRFRVVDASGSPEEVWALLGPELDALVRRVRPRKAR